MKCSICNKEIKKNFLNKIQGTYVKKSRKPYPVCSNCQKKYKKEEILAKL